MPEGRMEEIKESAEEILDSFIEISEGLPTEEETYYEQDTVNVLRSDGESKPDRELSKFRERFIKIMPDSDEQGNLKVEIAEWTR